MSDTALKKKLPRRIAIIGGDQEDHVGDSYRRALQDHYDVCIVNPETPIGHSIGMYGRAAVALRSAAFLVSQTLYRDAMALAYPKVIRTLRKFRPDVVLISFVVTISPEVIRELRLACPDTLVIGVFSDHIANFGRGYCFSADYDALFFKDAYVVEKMRSKLGWRHVWYLPQACDPGYHHTVHLSDADRSRYSCDITIAGNMHYFRAAQMTPLLGRDLKIWGVPPPRWFDHPIMKHHQGRPVFGDEKCRAMVAARVVLNNNYYAEIAGTNKRTFEVAAIGAFQLTDTPALAEIFSEDEVASFQGMNDMVEKIDYYLARPELRGAMAKRAQKRAHSEHTYAHRWTAKMAVLGLDVPHTFPVQDKDLRIRAR
jgi:spore maturation protein CgeB